VSVELLDLRDGRLVWAIADRYYPNVVVKVTGEGRDGMWVDFLTPGERRVVAIIDQPPVTVTVRSAGSVVAERIYER
jgi:hypothetical protein